MRKPHKNIDIRYKWRDYQEDDRAVKAAKCHVYNHMSKEHKESILIKILNEDKVQRICVSIGINEEKAL